MRTLRILVASLGIVSALSLAGCVSGRPLNVDPKATVDPAAMGVLVVGVEPLAEPEDLGKVHVSYYVRREGGGSSIFYVDKTQTVWALPLQPGEYYIADWYQSASVANRVGSPIKYRFHIVAGQATYIGTFETRLERHKNVFGMRVVPWSLVKVRDRRDRDIAQVQGNFPQVKDWPLRHEVVDGFDWGSTATGVPESVQQLAPQLVR